MALVTVGVAKKDTFSGPKLTSVCHYPSLIRKDSLKKPRGLYSVWKTLIPDVRDYARKLKCAVLNAGSPPKYTTDPGALRVLRRDNLGPMESLNESLCLEEFVAGCDGSEPRLTEMTVRPLHSHGHSRSHGHIHGHTKEASHSDVALGPSRAAGHDNKPSVTSAGVDPDRSLHTPSSLNCSVKEGTCIMILIYLLVIDHI